MTLQQLKYVMALDRHRSFARAAEECGVTQPTLSGMIAKLEDELGVRLFDRSGRRVAPTAIGTRIVRQAAVTLAEADRIRQLVDEERGAVDGNLHLAVGPSIAPYILPQFIQHYLRDYPQVTLSVEESRVEPMIDSILTGKTDIGIAIAGNACEGVREMPLYTEDFYVYLSESCRRRLPVFHPGDLSHENMWVMKEAQCLRESAFSFCKAREAGLRVYEAGNMETLIRVVDRCGGYTIIPQMHLPLLTERQRANVRPIDGNYLSQRRVSVYVAGDFVRQAVLDSVIATMQGFIPESMFSEKPNKKSEF